MEIISNVIESMGSFAEAITSMLILTGLYKQSFKNKKK